MHVIGIYDLPSEGCRQSGPLNLFLISFYCFYYRYVQYIQRYIQSTHILFRQSSTQYILSESQD